MEPFGMDEPDTPFDITDPGHRQTQDFLERCNLSNYLPAFIAEGFDTLSSIYEITENDMVDMQIKRGHRRVIQREIASAKGVPRNQPLDINPLRSSDSPVVMCTTLPMAPNNNNSNGGMLRDHRMNSTQNNIGKGLIGSHNGSMGGIGLGVGIGSNNNNGNTNHNINSGNSCGGNNNNGMNNNNNINNGNGGSCISGNSSTTGSATHFSHGAHTSGYGSMSSTVPSSVDTASSSSQRVPRKINTNANPNTNTNNTSIRSNSFSSNDDDEASTDTPSNQPKRKYRRHPKSDKHAPIKPPSAYIMFSNNARAQLRDQNMSFATIAKFVGDQWKNLSHEEKQSYERTAMQAKDEYISALERYRQTPEYKKYQAYLKDFTSKQEANNRQIGRARQRAKQGSTSSMVDSSSSRDLHRNNNSPSGSADGDAESSKSSSNSPQEAHTNSLMSSSLPGIPRSTKRRRAESPKSSNHMYESLMSTNPFTHKKSSQSERRRSRTGCSSPQGSSEPYPSQQQQQQQQRRRQRQQDEDGEQTRKLTTSVRRFSPRRANKQVKGGRTVYNTRRRSNRSSEDDSKELTLNDPESPIGPIDSFGSDDASYDMTGARPMKWTSSK